MAITTEDGTGLANAETYASVATADTYHAARNGTSWAALSTAAKEAALRLATEWLGQRYLGRWQGVRVKTTQALEWPRSDVCVDGIGLVYSTLPVQLVRATCELALKSLTTTLTADETAQVTSEQVGPIAVTYAAGARQQTRFAAVEALIRPLLKAGGGIPIVRG
ncbi:MAG: hypothetical protein EOP35_04130 [Rubrivivax sp.]|nr:MAG: hypothetical protein EOP35_04130 [Rubrivivax sp.]